MSRVWRSIARVRTWLPVVAVALAAGLAAVGGSYLSVGRRPAFVATPVDRVVIAASPEALVTVAITQLGTLGHQVAFLTAIALTCLLFGLSALPGVLLLRWREPVPDALARRSVRTIGGVIAGTVLPGALAFGLTRSPVSSAGTAAGVGLVLLVTAGTGVPGAGADGPLGSLGRRRVLGAVGSAIGLSAVGLFVRGTGEESFPPGLEIPEDARPEVRELLTRAKDQSLAVEGLEPLVSTDFYEVDIANVNPDVDRGAWSLSITGAVEEEAEYDVSDIEAMELEDRFVTLRCVGDQLNGRQMDTALWGGVPVERLLEEANPRGDRVVLHGADSYYNEFPINALWPGLLAYRMNGRPLPRAHGAPVRALVPGHWGEINVKWLTEIEVRDEDTMGYWEHRGWHGTGPVETVAKLWQVNRLGGGRVEVAGHAYAGTRGIEAVEVSTDGGDTWDDAELSDPLPGEDVWRQWRHEYGASGTHEMIVRARDGDGDHQIPEEDGPKPDGATGWVSKTVGPQ
ncbi:oxidoreductase molybdopterin binding protein [Haloterrigena turkmenica DSM 5511]|uniref:Oxidoreductase molybdopterin binding protein n=1 Tax=Haloterrigena turkmenica (strain ATCC 51198 / DSM 5511 / JCM 9101 / NCIMB 13204 / VKM B-1734 / 4k) TaxID=543526 RepID=D2RUN7_HALTV|nr:molybdopterin-dependent oxidoreductase [Haloterrigena turkmenica]ADB61209.1 oxidoreductase molybdopterin binding protein [Haloterrigena turkmenica DSM 5511]